MILDKLIGRMRPGVRILGASILYTALGMYVGHVLFHYSISMVFISIIPLLCYIYIRRGTFVTKNELTLLYSYAFLEIEIVFELISDWLVAVAIVGAPKNLFLSNRFGSQILEAASLYTIGVGILIVTAFLESFALPAMIGIISVPW